MSKVGKLTKLEVILKARSEVSALEHLKRLIDYGYKAHYIRHHREDFSVCVHGDPK